MTLLVYGAYGYTGELIAEEAVERGLEPILAGRDDVRTENLAASLGCESRVFAVDDAERHLQDVDVILNCAGPFVDTHEPLVDACLETGTHYLDITGEIQVFEAIAERDREAEKAGVCLLPGVGFDVVPTDCLAGHLHDRLPGATELRLGLDGSGSISKGTLATMLEHADKGGKVRRDGEVIDVPTGHLTRRIDFGRGERAAATIPWGDVSTAYYTTGIENVEVYFAMPSLAAESMKYSALTAPILGFEPVKRSLQSLVRKTVDGPSEETRRRASCYVWGEATDGETTVTSRLKTGETYALTVEAATTAAERVLDDPPVGFETPAAAFTPEFVLDLEGVQGFFDE
jgi:short subunit dehydrogenase-like uncharacterized protein